MSPNVIFHDVFQGVFLKLREFGRIMSRFSSTNEAQTQKNTSTKTWLPWEPTVPSFLGVITHRLGVQNLHFFMFFWGPRALIMFLNLLMLTTCRILEWTYKQNFVFEANIPSGELTWQLKSTIFNTRYIFKVGPFSIAVLI